MSHPRPSPTRCRLGAARLVPRLARRASLPLTLASLVTLSACADMSRRFKEAFNKDEAPAAADDLPSPSQAVDGTVQSVAYVEGLRKIVVRGYGIVFGLVGTGGADCPDEVRKYLQKEILRRRLNIPPAELLDTRDAAPVVVTAEIPAAAQAGARFDVVIRPLGSQSVSLAGGSLLECDLKLLSPTARGIIEGKTLAVAAGPVFISPFVRPDESAAPEGASGEALRVGRVLGGGKLLEDRRLNLTLNSPAYSVAARVRDRLNSRFGSAEPVADAVSPELVRLRVPTEFRQRERAFIELVMHTALNGSPPALQRRAADLAAEIVHPDALYEDISLTWEAIGRTVLPAIRPLYAHANVAASYYAARAGLRLGDDEAVGVIARHARQLNSPFREFAVEELAAATASRRAADELRALLADSDNRLRLKALDGLLRHRDPAVQSARVADTLWLDVIPADGPPLVHVATSDLPRIAIVGRNVRCKPPASYVDDLVTLSADAGGDAFRVMRKNPRTGRASDELSAPLDLPDLVRFLADAPVPDRNDDVTGLGLDYSSVVRVLYRLNRDEVLPATLIFQRPSVSDQLWKLKTRDRPESEL